MGKNADVVIQRNFLNTCKELDFHILKIPILKTYKTKINIHDGILSIELDKVTLTLKIYKAMKYPTDYDLIFSINLFDFKCRMR